MNMTAPDATAFLADWRIDFDELRAFVRPIHDGVTLLLVGSIADGLANELSDIDLLLLGSGSLERRDAVVDVNCEYATTVMKGHEVHVECWHPDVIDRLVARMTAALDSFDDTGRFEPDQSLDDDRLCLLSRIRNGVVVAGADAAAGWRGRCQSHRLPLYLRQHWLHGFRTLRSKALAEGRYGHPGSAQQQFRGASVCLVGALLCTIGETNTYSKWRPRLLQRHRDTIGAETTDVMLRSLFAPRMTASEMATAFGLLDQIEHDVVSAARLSGLTSP